MLTRFLEMLKSFLFWEILKRYRLFFLIAVTFFVEAVILIVVQNEELTIVELIIKNTTQLSILMLVTTFIYLFFAALLDIDGKIPDTKKEDKKSDNEKSDFAGGVLTRLLIGSFSASTIPTGVSLVLCAFADMGYIRHLSGVEIYIAFAGISLMSIAVLSTYEEEDRISKGIKKVASSNVSDLT